METTPAIEPPPSAWTQATRAPSPRLRAYIGQFDGYTQGAATPQRILEVPFAGVPLVISFDSDYEIVNSSGRSERHQTFVAGMADSWVVVQSAKQSTGLQVNFTPIGARMFLGVSMQSITNRTVELEDIFGRRSRDVVEQLQSAPDWAARFDLLEAMIGSRLDAAGPAPSPVVWAWNKMQASSGNLSIGSLAGEMGYSHKHLITRFRDEFGLPPKTLARVVRFERAVRKIRKGSAAPNWLDLADDCGYFDQAHLIRDFREFSGLTPIEFAARQTDYGGVAAQSLDGR
ncbi:MAG: helix-turn-helix domain-containing protein [Chloroflexota bacterium]